MGLADSRHNRSVIEVFVDFAKLAGFAFDGDEFDVHRIHFHTGGVFYVVDYAVDREPIDFSDRQHLNLIIDRIRRRTSEISQMFGSPWILGEKCQRVTVGLIDISGSKTPDVPNDPPRIGRCT
jgi:hypothetical protein